VAPSDVVQFGSTRGSARSCATVFKSPKNDEMDMAVPPTAFTWVTSTRGFAMSSFKTSSLLNLQALWSGASPFSGPIQFTLTAASRESFRTTSRFPSVAACHKRNSFEACLPKNAINFFKNKGPGKREGEELEIVQGNEGKNRKNHTEMGFPPPWWATEGVGGGGQGSF